VTSRPSPLGRAALGTAIAIAITGAGWPASGQPEPSPAAVRAGPSIKETGRVAKTGVADPGIKIRDAHSERATGELPVDKLPAPVERPTSGEASGQIDEAVLARQIRSRFAGLSECPVEVARHRHMSRASAASGRFTLRWTILRSGRVADTAVVANSTVNDRVMDCVKRRMNGWSFTPPVGGSVHLERPFRFGAR
jgi:hypothetical protein